MGISYRNPLRVYLCTLLFISYTHSFFSHADNRITQGQTIRDGETIISSGQKFELGFFSPGNSTLRYVGIWYHNISVQSVIWVANRENPISTTARVLTITSNGNLAVLDENANSVWSTNASIVSKNSTAVLMDTGNLILSSSDSVGDPNNALWQTFNDTADTYLPEMRVYMNVQEGENRAFTSWKSENDPSSGRYSMGIDPRGSPQIVIWEGQNRRWRSGHWNGLIFTGIPNTRTLYFYGFRLTNEGDGNMYFTYTTLNSSHIVRFWIRWDGIGEQLIWDEGKKDWGLLQSQPSNTCDVYDICGTFAECISTDSRICTCIEGFEPKYTDQWNKGNWSGGCVRRTPLQCEKNSSSDGFLVVGGVKLPDYADTVVAENTNECEDECLNNCSCNAYTFVSGMGCMIWSGDLIDIEQFSSGGKTLYIRLARSELGGKRKISNLAIIVIVVSGTIFLGISIWLLWRFRAKLKAFSSSWRKREDNLQLNASKSREFSTDFSGPDDFFIEGKPGDGPELPLFNFNLVAVATNNFANENRLGQGGFGPVYKGTLPGGQEIAVKRLSRCSGQGLQEFKNEIILIAKLQHRNLVRLLGCCIEGEEKMLLYEYMPNKSLDFFLFGLFVFSYLITTFAFYLLSNLYKHEQRKPNSQLFMTSSY
ncbi:hypothetical protein F0562_018982 [Nyssa sinensis]|uniref:Non-specific serine/threonine protein kinase n=1 Tax=Nyssa sinensis TaxID=561372 RepID=A0A5J4ZDN0_9ASTE|nr:hypothetical protein F0562_018982 [Nyssa sinensis]